MNFYATFTVGSIGLCALIMFIAFHLHEKLRSTLREYLSPENSKLLEAHKYALVVLSALIFTIIPISVAYIFGRVEIYQYTVCTFYLVLSLASIRIVRKHATA